MYTYKNLNFRNNILPISLLGIFLLTSFNSIFNSFSVALGGSVNSTTFLMPPFDLFGDYFKAVFSFDSNSLLRFNLKYFDKLSNVLNEYLQNNNYKTINAVTGMPSNLNGMPLSTAYYALNLRAMTVINPLVLYVVNILFILTLICLVINELIVRPRDKLFLLFAIALSYPFLFFLVRGHLFSWFTTLSLFAYLVALKNKHLNMALFFLAIACNFRPNAIIFFSLLLLVIQNNIIISGFKSFIKFGAIFIVIFIPSLVIANYFYAPYTFINFTQAVANYHSNYVLGNAGLAYGSSLHGLIKVIFLNSNNNEVLILIFTFICVCLAGFFYIKKYLNGLSFIFIISSFYCLATSVFADYYLGIFFLPLIFICMMTSQEKNISTVNIVQIFSCILLLSPKNYLYFSSGISYQVLINPLILCCALVWTYKDALNNSKTHRLNNS